MKNQFSFYVALFIVVIFTSCAKSAKPDGAVRQGTHDSVNAPVDMVKPDDQSVDVDTAVADSSIIEVTTEPQNGKAMAEMPRRSVRIEVGKSIKVDTVPIVKTQKVQGTMVYYCPSRMLENTDNNVSVTITKAALAEAVEQLQKRVTATTGKSPEAINSNITGTSITLASKMKVELKYSDKDFETIYKPENESQFFDGIDDLNWDWIIRPLKVGNVQLSIIISAYDEKRGQWISVQTPPRIFNVKVQVDPRGYFSKLWGFLGAHPEWLFVQILFPLIAFFYGKRKGKKSKK